MTNENNYNEQKVFENCTNFKCNNKVKFKFKCNNNFSINGSTKINF